MKTLLTISAVVTMASHAAALAGDTVELTFVDHLEAKMIEQDVYVEKERGSGMVSRVTVDDHAGFLDETVFTTATGVSHDPMNASAIGPYDKGHDLGLTLGEWLAASGTASYACREEKGMLSAEFSNLVPNGLYTMWTFYLPTPSTDPFTTYDIPIGARDGSESVFRASPSGAADFDLTFEPCLQGTGSQLASGLAIAYHSDGKSYGHEPGSMGDKTHVHLFALLPSSERMPMN